MRMITTSRAARLAVAALAGVALTVAMAMPAAAGKATGSCRDGQSSANFATIYTARGGWNVVDWFEFRLTNPNRLGNKSNAKIQHYQNINNWDDTLKYSWDSADNIRQNITYVHNPTSTAQTVQGKSAHTRFDFAFDNSGPDDTCHADTNDFR